MIFCFLFYAVGAAAAYAGTNSYSNDGLGYSLSYPADMQVDTGLGDVCTIFRNDECQIEVYYQPLKTSSYMSYVNYSNSGFSSNGVDHQNYRCSKQTINGRTVYITKWNRTKLKNIENVLITTIQRIFAKAPPRHTASFSNPTEISPVITNICLCLKVSSANKRRAQPKLFLFRKRCRNRAASEPIESGNKISAGAVFQPGCPINLGDF